MREEALDVDFYWVNETGDHANLSAGISLRPTVETFVLVPEAPLSSADSI